MILLAPLQGYTDCIFRNVYGRHYAGVDLAVSPFISLIDGKRGYASLSKDVLPTNNTSLPVIPQLMGNNPDYFIKMSGLLHEWGYSTINWNLGCPVKKTAAKKRGAGLLPYPKMIRNVLEKVIPNVNTRISIKMRLGYHSTDEIYQLIPILNDFPLESITIHPRTGKQMYEGQIHHDILNDCISKINHKIIYSGDIFNRSSFKSMQIRYPSITDWMIGRGVFFDPSLIESIKEMPADTEIRKRERYHYFLTDLYQEMQRLRPESLVVRKIKNLWKLFSEGFDDAEIVFDRIAHSTSTAELFTLTEDILANSQFRKTE